jgi:hypothetical protein
VIARDRVTAVIGTANYNWPSPLTVFPMFGVAAEEFQGMGQDVDYCL